MCYRQDCATLSCSLVVPFLFHGPSSPRCLLLLIFRHPWRLRNAGMRPFDSHFLQWNLDGGLPEPTQAEGRVSKGAALCSF